MTPSLRFDILRRDGFTCRYCGRKPPTVILEADHIDPKANGGKDTLDNLITACGPCNRGKRDVRGVLPPPPSEPTPAEYPIGLFFNLYRDPDEPPDPEHFGQLHPMCEQGYVLAVQGDDVWCATFDLEGIASFIRAVPRNNWRRWQFYDQARDMRYWYTYASFSVGFVPWSDVARFEEFDALRFDDKVRLRAFYEQNPQWDPDRPDKHSLFWD